MAEPEEFPLARELDTFEEHRQELMGRAAGKYALVRGDQVAAEFDTEGDAIAEGYRRFGNVPFLVKQIEPMDIPQRFVSYMSAG
jgi:hypothetical protein